MPPLCPDCGFESLLAWVKQILAFDFKNVENGGWLYKVTVIKDE